MVTFSIHFTWNTFSHGVQFGNEPREQTPSRHLGEQLFYALFGVDNIPVCLVCDEDDEHAKSDVTETSNLGIMRDLIFSIVQQKFLPNIQYIP